MAETVSQRSYTRLPHTFLPVVPANCIQAAEATALEIDIPVREFIADASVGRQKSCGRRVLSSTKASSCY
jgi:hypothetical protein